MNGRASHPYRPRYDAAMEPAGGRPGKSSRGQQPGGIVKVLQWSQLVNGRTSIQPIRRNHSRPSPQWKPISIGPARGRRRGDGCDTGGAAMEPAVDWPGDAIALMVAGLLQAGLQWSRPVISRASLPRRQHAPRHDGASMEPAGDRPGEGLGGVEGGGQDLSAMEPARDRPGEAVPYQAVGQLPELQWRQPGEGSRNSGDLSCANGGSCERSPLGEVTVLSVVVKMRKRPATCDRAPPRGWTHRRGARTTLNS
jgi:hypothetical protein